MSNVFSDYARFYDDLYREKDYRGETQYVLSVAGKTVRRRPTSVLDMGCGTARHVIPFVKQGLEATGFDVSSSMVAAARKNLEREKINARIELGDARTYRDGRTYDLVVSMFAVMGYLTSNDDFLKGLETARAHMHRNSVFVFDVWFGPAVLHQRPETRVQEFTTDGKKTLRIVRPEIHIGEQTVTVEYDILKFENKRVTEEAHERHTMRYFFEQEIRLFLKDAGLELKRIHPFMDLKKSPTVNDWNVVIIAKPI